MELVGYVRNGVVVLAGSAKLPEGTAVTVVYPATSSSPLPVGQKRVSFPLIHSEQPGSALLTSERIAEILDEEDAAP